mgnify:CR=1 FL=1
MALLLLVLVLVVMSKSGSCENLRRKDLSPEVGKDDRRFRLVVVAVVAGSSSSSRLLAVDFVELAGDTPRRGNRIGMFAVLVGEEGLWWLLW